MDLNCNVIFFARKMLIWMPAFVLPFNTKIKDRIRLRGIQMYIFILIFSFIVDDK